MSKNQSLERLELHGRANKIKKPAKGSISRITPGPGEREEKWRGGAASQCKQHWHQGMAGKTPREYTEELEWNKIKAPTWGTSLPPLGTGPVPVCVNGSGVRMLRNVPAKTYCRHEVDMLFVYSFCVSFNLSYFQIKQSHSLNVIQMLSLRPASNISGWFKDKNIAWVWGPLTDCHITHDEPKCYEGKLVFLWYNFLYSTAKCLHLIVGRSVSFLEPRRC